MTSVMWFRKDLRLTDNRALSHAYQESERLLFFFQVNPKQFIIGSPSHQAFFASVAAFKKKVDDNDHLQIYFGDPVASFKELKKAIPDFRHIYFNADDTGYGAIRDQEVRAYFKEAHIHVHDYSEGYLHSADEVKNNVDENYKIFTPYYKKWCEKKKDVPLRLEKNPVLTIEKKPLFMKEEEKFIEFCQALPERSDAFFGEQAAQTYMHRFIQENLHDYATLRDYPFLDKTSRLSRFLRTGELSIRTLWEEIQQAPDSKGRETFEKELCWRDFYHMIYVSYPNQKQEAIKENYRNIEWENNRDHFKKWQEGRTGYPIVDAAMRQLKETGWMHNRLRMIVASFLTKDLLIDWRWGERYFQQMLVDYDPASNIGGWQWAASTGTDAVPYFRIFNPTTQSERFDGEGEFIRQFVPELRRLPKKWIHQPEKMKKEQQEEYGIQLGIDYPYPIVNHHERRKIAIARYEFSNEWQ